MHGYDVARRFAADSDLGLVLPLELGTVYGVLKELQARRLIKGQREVNGRRPPRTVFSLQPAAEAELRQWLQAPIPRMRDLRATLLVKLYFCRHIGAGCALRLLDAQLDASQAYLSELLRHRLSLQPGGFDELVCGSDVSAVRATIAWLEQEGERAAAATSSATLE